MYSFEELERSLGVAQRRATQGAILRTGHPQSSAAAELVSGTLLTWRCGCRAGADDSLPDGTILYTLEPCEPHRGLPPGIVAPCGVLAELSGLREKVRQLSESPSSGACRRALLRAMELGIANIPVIFDRPFDELGGSTLNTLLANGDINHAADGLERILENHPELRIVRIEE